MKNFNYLATNHLNTLSWIKLPSDPVTYLFMMIPLMASQILQRFFHILENRFIANLNESILLIHNIQYNFIIIGQFLGIAGSTTALILFNRTENELCQKDLAKLILKWTIIFGIIIFIPSYFTRDWIIQHFKIDPTNQHLASIYICIGLINMILQSIFGTIEGMLISQRRQKMTFLLAFILVVLNLVTDLSIITLITNPKTALIFIGLSTTCIYLLIVFASLYYLCKNLTDSRKMQYTSFFRVWIAELGIVIVRSIAPFFYSFLSVSVIASTGFLVNYNFALHLAYIAALPLSAGLQVSVSQASRQFSLPQLKQDAPEWWSNFAYLSLLPTLTILFFLIFFPINIINIIYSTKVAQDHLIFLQLFFIACLIGQLGHVLTIKIRAHKKSHLVTQNYLFSEIGIHIGIVALIVHFHRATPVNMGLAAIAFSSFYLILNFIFFQKLSISPKQELHYVK